MAFDKDDCDLLYDTQMFPLLKKNLKLEVIRVDRKEYKDDLNNVIIKKLTEADIVVADLTYARPSVYYEAGFADRKIPVVYTARKDHLSKSQIDEHLRVHFDLQMKKVIPWASPEDPTFSKRLKQRVNYFLGPLHGQIKMEGQIEINRQAFDALSVTDKCSKIMSKFTRKMRAKRFWITGLYNVSDIAAQRLRPALGIFGAKLVDKVCFESFVVVAESLTKLQLAPLMYASPGYFLASNKKNDGIGKFRTYYFICTLRKFPDSRFTSLFPHADPLKTPGRYIIEDEGSPSQPDYQKTINLISPIKSSVEALALAKEALDELPQEKTNKYTSLDGSFGYPRICFTRLKDSKKKKRSGIRSNYGRT
jgi:nucleoside 2-deoxyribosyltransferase